MNTKREEFLEAISAVFEHANLISSVGTWHVIVESSPRREIDLMPSFVARNIDGGGMRPSDLTVLLRAIGDNGGQISRMARAS